MYLPRSLISHLYLNLVRTHHSLSPPVLILVALEPDALCACRILTSLLKRDYVPHKIHPIAGYGDLIHAGEELVRPMRLADGGSGGVVACLGVGGLVDIAGLLGLAADEGGPSGVDVWIFDSRRPWNLTNLFGGLPSTPLATESSTHSAKTTQVGIQQGELTREYRTDKGGIVVYDDGDIEEEMAAQREAWYALESMPELGNDNDSLVSDSDVGDHSRGSSVSPGRKRKSPSHKDEEEEDESDKENTRPRQRRRSNHSTPLASPPSSSPHKSHRLSPVQATPPSNQQSSSPPSLQAQPSARTLRRRLLRLRRQHDATLRAYESLGTSYSEPISSLMYSLASELGREDNDLLWLSIVGVSSIELYGHTPTGLSVTNHDALSYFTGWTGSRGSRIRQLLRDEVRRLNPPDLTESGREVARGLLNDAIPTHGRSPTDNSIRLSPEPRFLLIRHWSLYDSMLHSPYLSAKLHIWSDAGRRRLHKLLAKMGVSLSQCKQNYTHMDLDLKRDLRQKLLQTAPLYGLDGLLPLPSTSHGGREGWGFVRSWGWKACLSAMDVAVLIGAMLEVGTKVSGSRCPASDPITPAEEALARFYNAYDALLSPVSLVGGIPLAQTLHRAILRTGTALLQKKQIRHLRAFRMGLVKDGPDIGLFMHPGALIKLALWVGQAIAEVDRDDGKSSRKRSGTPLVLGCIDESRDVYVVVGMGGGGQATEIDRSSQQKETNKRKAKERKEREDRREARRREREAREYDEELGTEEEDVSSASSEDSDSSEDDKGVHQKRKGQGRNRFGNAFQEVIEETNARVRLDSFEHCVVEVRKEDLSGFLESLSMKAVIG